MSEDWQRFGRCKTDPSPDDWFPHPKAEGNTPAIRRAYQVCLSCPVIWDCQDYARREGIPHGIFGGESARERKRYWSTRGGRPTHNDAIVNSLLANGRPLLGQGQPKEAA